MASPPPSGQPHRRVAATMTVKHPDYAQFRQPHRRQQPPQNTKSPSRNDEGPLHLPRSQDRRTGPLADDVHRTIQDNADLLAAPSSTTATSATTTSAKTLNAATCCACTARWWSARSTCSCVWPSASTRATWTAPSPPTTTSARLVHTPPHALQHKHAQAADEQLLPCCN